MSKNRFIKLANGYIWGSIGRGKKDTPSISKIKHVWNHFIDSEARYEEQYEKMNQKYENWINSLLDIKPDKYPNQTFIYARLANGNHFISLSKDKTREWTMSGEVSQGGGVASLIWHHTTGDIIGIGVEKEYQRKGIATELYRLAMKLSESPAKIIAPAHSEVRSPEGQAWAKSVGGVIPEVNGYATPEYWDMSDRP